MVVGGLTVTDTSIAGYLPLRANRMVKDVGCMGTRTIRMRERGHRRIGEINGGDDTVEAIDRDESGVC